MSRFRLTASTTAPDVSPALQSYSHNAPSTVRRKLLLSDSTALGAIAYAPDAADHLAAGDSLFGQFVSDPMPAGISFGNGQTIKMAQRGSADRVNDNLFLQMYLAVVSLDGSTVRRVLRSKVADDVALSATSTNRFFSTTQDGATYVTVDGDRLVFEESLTGTPTVSAGVDGHNGSLRVGSNGAGGDAPENDTDTSATVNPWFEIVSTTVTFGGTSIDSGAGADTLAALGTATAADTATGADTISAGQLASLPDSALASDSFAVTVPVSVADTGVGVDTVSLLFFQAIADTAAAADGFSVYVANPLGSVVVSDAAAGSVVVNAEPPGRGLGYDAGGPFDVGVFDADVFDTVPSSVSVIGSVIVSDSSAGSVTLSDATEGAVVVP